MLFTIAGTYVAICIAMVLLENKLLYHPVRASSEWVPPPDGLVVEDVWLDSADGTRIHALWHARPGADGALIYCHGNGGNLSFWGAAVQELSEALKVSVLIFDYPGFGKSDGSPDEAGCIAAADAAYDWLSKKVHPDWIILYGESLGGGVATDLATRKQHRALVLTKTFTSVPDTAQKLYPFLPARWLVHSQYNNLEKIGQLKRPVFIIHGDRDELIPFSMGERLFAAANEPKKFYPVPGCRHNDGLPPECFTSLAEFLHAKAPITAYASAD